MTSVRDHDLTDATNYGAVVDLSSTREIKSLTEEIERLYEALHLLTNRVIALEKRADEG